ncbi:MAG TPA: OmpA family protein, partial [Sandaracinaceae bacterium]
YDEAELRPEGIDQLDVVVEHYRQYGDRYDRLIVGGHADARGTIPYNEELSRRRAEAVVNYLVSQGVPRDVIEVRAYGELLPAIPEAQTPFEHQVNRRVAFEVQWAEGRRPEGEPPQASPTMPERVDEAPEYVERREQRPEVREREEREREQAEAAFEALDEGERLALEREREGSARATAMARAEAAEIEREAQEPVAARTE